VKRAGDTSGRTSDYAAWQQDMEERRNRSAALSAKRQANKPQDPKVELSAIDDALIALETAADDFEGPTGFGKPNLPLIEKRALVADLESRLKVARQELQVIESRGDSVDRLTAAVRQAESQLQSLVSKAESADVMALAEKHYGWPIPHSKISSEMKREFALHASVLAFKTLYVPRSIVNPGQTLTVQQLQSQLQIVGEKLTALRDHLSEE
jgi:uncharacterized coiled-coil protein SlyX